MDGSYLGKGLARATQKDEFCLTLAVAFARIGPLKAFMIMVAAITRPLANPHLKPYLFARDIEVSNLAMAVSLELMG